MDLKIVLGKSLDIFVIGESLRNVVLAMQCSMPKVRAVFLYESHCPVLNDIYIRFGYDEELHGGKYLIEFDPFLQVIRAVNYTVSTLSKPNAMWKISGCCDISQCRPLAARDFISKLGEPLQVFAAQQGQVLKLLYNGLCLIFKLDHPCRNTLTTEAASLEAIKELGSQLTNIRLIPIKESPHFRCLVDRMLPEMHKIDVTLYGLVQVGLVIEEKSNQVAGINVVFPSDQHSMSIDTRRVTRVYFGHSCQCVMMSLGAPDFVYYQQKPTEHLMLPANKNSLSVPQQFIFNYRQIGLDVVFDVEAKQVKRFVFHSNSPDHIDINMYGRCFYKFGITENGFARRGKSFSIHPGVKWSAVTEHVALPQVKFLSKLYRNNSTNALYPHPLSMVWLLFNQLLCEVTESDCIATISVCSVNSGQQLDILGRNDEELLVNTGSQEGSITEENSLDNTTAACSDDVKISLPDDNDNQPQTTQTIRPGSTEPPSMEPYEESFKGYHSVHSEGSEIFHSFIENTDQDDERGSPSSDHHLKPQLPYAYPFQAYHPNAANQISPCSSNTLITLHEDISREATNIDHCQFVHVEIFAEDANITTSKEASDDHVLMESEKWRISCFNKEEEEAFDDVAVREEGLQAMHQLSLEENFVCDSPTTMVTLEPTSDDIATTGGLKFEETDSTLDQEGQTKADVISHKNDEKDSVIREDVISSEPSMLESCLEENTELGHETDNTASEAATINTSSVEESNMLEENGNDVGEDKVTETKLVYKPQLAKVSALRTQRILKTVTSLPKKHSEHQPRRKKSNDSGKPTESHDQKPVKPKVGTKSKNPSAIRVDHRKVHFYTEEKSKVIAAKLKPKESSEVVRRSHKDGTAYPHHHFKSSQLSDLLQQSDDVTNHSGFPSKTAAGASTSSTFNRIFATGGGDTNIPKTQRVIQKLNTPFATEYNSTVYSEVTDSEELLPTSDDQTASQDGQTAGKVTSDDDQGQGQDDKIKNQDDLVTTLIDHNSNQDDQTTNQDHPVTIQDDQSATHNNKITNQDDLTRTQSNQDNHIFHDNQFTTQVTNDLINDCDHQTKQPEELGTTSIQDVVTEVSFDVTDHKEEIDHKTDLSDALTLPVDKAPNDTSISAENSVKNCSEVTEDFTSTSVEDFDAIVTANGCPKQLEPHDEMPLIHTADNHSDNEEHVISSATDESHLGKQCSSMLLDDNMVDSPVTNDSVQHSSTEEEGLLEIRENLSPRKQWPTTQAVQSTPDSLNQEHIMFEHLLGGHEDVCNTLLDRMEFLGHVSKCLNNGEPISSLNLDSCESSLIADVMLLMYNSDSVSLALEDEVELLLHTKQLLLPNKTDREIDVAVTFTTQVIESHHELLKRYHEGQMKKDAMEYFHCQQCYDTLEDVAKLIEQLLSSETIAHDTINRLDKLSSILTKLFRKLETT